MKYDLLNVRKSYGFSMQEMGNFLGIMPNYYSKYEEEGEIPSKYIYKLWLKIKDFPIPNDFFLYTSFTLLVNQKYHGLTQQDLAKMFEISGQSTISSLLSENIPMYELKDHFGKFKPFIIPVEVDNQGIIGREEEHFRMIQELSEKGNFVCAERKRKTRQLRRKLEVPMG